MQRSLSSEKAQHLRIWRIYRNGNEALTSVIQLIQQNHNYVDYEANGNSKRSTVTMTDISIGLKWEHCFECCGVYHPFALAFAWEQNAFYDLNDFGFIAGATPAGTALTGAFGTNNTSSKAGNLVTQGLTITATIGF